MPEISFLLLYQPSHPEGQWLIGFVARYSGATARDSHLLVYSPQVEFRLFLEMGHIHEVWIVWRTASISPLDWIFQEA